MAQKPDLSKELQAFEAELGHLLNDDDDDLPKPPAQTQLRQEAKQETKAARAVPRPPPLPVISAPPTPAGGSSGAIRAAAPVHYEAPASSSSSTSSSAVKPPPLPMHLREDTDIMSTPAGTPALAADVKAVQQQVNVQSSTFNRGKKYVRAAASKVWEDPTLNEWPENDFRIFCGDLGNEVTDAVLAKAFSHYKSFAKAKVIRDKVTGKTKGYGFVSFLDPADCAAALKEMNGKYVGNRPIKLRKSTWEQRDISKQAGKVKLFRKAAGDPGPGPKKKRPKKVAVPWGSTGQEDAEEEGEGEGTEYYNPYEAAGAASGWDGTQAYGAGTGAPW